MQTTQYCMIKITIDAPMSLKPPPVFCTTVKAAKLNPMKEAWKYLIRKFQKIVFLILITRACTFGLFLVTNTARPTTISNKKITIAESATPSSA